MQELSLFISGLMAHLIYLCHPTPRVVVKTEVEIQERLDPSGLAYRDITFAEKFHRQPQYKTGDKIEDIAYRQGQSDMLRFFKEKVIGRRTDKI